jgi:hypothetical protein
MHKTLDTLEDVDGFTDDELAAHFERELRAEVERFEQEREQPATNHAANLFGVLQAAVDTVES